MISPGNTIAFDKSTKLFVHASCARIMSLVLRTQETAHKCRRSDTVPHGLRSKTLKTYTAEWLRYLDFAARAGYSRLPGKDCPWQDSLLWDYLQFRATTCKPSTVKGHLSALAHFGSHHRQLLATSRFDCDSLMYRNIAKMKNQLLLDRREKFNGDDTRLGPNQCTPLAQRSVELILNAFAVSDEDSFLMLSRANRHHIAACVMQHTAGMRFGHFPARAYTREMFVRDAADGSYRLMTDWHRFPGRRRFCLLFPAFPEHDCMWYVLRNKHKVAVDRVSAATIMAWHFGALQRAGEHTVFAPAPGEPPSRKDRVAWLQKVISLALPADDHRARAMIKDITPHSFRPGMAGDLLRAGIRLSRIAHLLRWSDERNVRLYGDRLPLGAARLSTRYNVIDQTVFSA